MGEAEALAENCRKAAQFYQSNPGLSGAGTMIDLYWAIARLADIVSRSSSAQLSPESAQIDPERNETE